MTKRDYRLGIIQQIDNQVSKRPMYIYSVEVYSPTAQKWYGQYVEFTLLTINRYLHTLGLDIMAIPVSVRRYSYQ